MDEVLFKLAYLLTSVKKEDQARDYFLRLIREYPNSKYIPDAYLSFAEFYFNKGEMDNALRFYEKVEQFPKSSVYPYAVYKKGWCYVNLGDFKTALETFVGVVRMTQDPKASNISKAQKQALEKEAKKDIVKAYSHVGGPDKAWEFFQRTGGDFAPKMMEALAEMYWEQGKFAESSRVYRKVISMNMDSPRICEWQNKVVRNTLSQGSKRDQVQEIQRLGAVYDRVADMKAIKKDQLEECKTVLPRHVEGAGAHLAQGSAEDQEPRHLRPRDAGLQGLPRALPRRQGVLRDGVLLRRDPVDRRRAG